MLGHDQGRVGLVLDDGRRRDRGLTVAALELGVAVGGQKEWGEQGQGQHAEQAHQVLRSCLGRANCSYEEVLYSGPVRPTLDS